MKIRKANKKNEWHMVRRFGVERVKQVNSNFFVAVGASHFHVTYYYGVGFGPVAVVRTMIDAVDEMDAYTKVMNALRNKEITTNRARQREDIRDYRMAKRARKGGIDAWHRAIKEYLTGLKDGRKHLLVVG